MIKTNFFDSEVELQRRRERLFSNFLVGLHWLSDNKKIENVIDFNRFQIIFEDTNLEARQVKSLFRAGYKDGTLNFSNFSDGRVLYLSRCLGHKISSSYFLKFPRLCVLYSLCILKERWRSAEDYIVKDDMAVYLYSKYVIGGILPEKMHTEIVLGTVLHKSLAIQKYFSEIEGLQRKKLCYN